MLVYIIDGFNVVHKDPALKASATPRRDLLALIRTRRLTGSVKNRVIVVFDGSPDEQCVLEKGNFEVRFSGPGQTADSIIERLVENTPNKSEIVVVSDDRQIREHARRRSARLCKSGEFLAVKEKTGGEPDKDIPEGLKREIDKEMRRIWLNEE